MPIYTGRSADGWDAREVQGMFISEDGETWSNEPFTQEQIQSDREYKRITKIIDEIHLVMSGKFTIQDIYNKIINKQPTMLSARCKQYVINLIKH